jgi:N-acetyl-gamma-glutamyl-phosphate reductase
MTLRVAILGASGYAGAELMRLCAGHPVFKPAAVYGDSNAGQEVGVLYPHLALAYRDLRFSPTESFDARDVDLVFSAMPHGQSQKIADKILGPDRPWVDLGADFRLDTAEEYRTWYGEEHARPDLLGEFVYGLPEIMRERLRTARRVAAPGCYPTSAILVLRPLVQAGLVEAKGLIVDAASGASGAGRAAKVETGFCTIDESFSAYGLVNHRHTAEMEAGIGGEVLFTPHLAPMNRGILATCYATPREGLTAEAPIEALRAAYAGEPFVHVGDAPPATKNVLGSNAVHLTARLDPRTNRVIAIAALDNLVKGAAGQMIQCANLMFGLEETAGLSVCGVFP